MRRTLCLFSITLLLFVPAIAQPQGRGGGFKKQAVPGELRKYDDVVTKSAKTRPCGTSETTRNMKTCQEIVS